MYLKCIFFDTLILESMDFQIFPGPKMETSKYHYILDKLGCNRVNF